MKPRGAALGYCGREAGTTSAALAAELPAGFHLGIDCPDSYRAVLHSTASAARRELRLGDINDMLITHVHGDHMNGLEGVAYFNLDFALTTDEVRQCEVDSAADSGASARRASTASPSTNAPEMLWKTRAMTGFGLGRAKSRFKRFVESRRLRLIASREVREVIWEQRLLAPMGALWDGQRFEQMAFESYFDFQELSWTEETTVGPFTLRARRTKHHVPTSALLIEAGGQVLGYSADTAFDPDLLRFLEPADLIIHETNYGPAHSPYEALAALPGALRSSTRSRPGRTQVCSAGIALCSNNRRDSLRICCL